MELGREIDAHQRAPQLLGIAGIVGIVGIVVILPPLHVEQAIGVGQDDPGRIDDLAVAVGQVLGDLARTVLLHFAPELDGGARKGRALTRLGNRRRIVDVDHQRRGRSSRCRGPDLARADPRQAHFDVLLRQVDRQAIEDLHAPDQRPARAGDHVDVRSHLAFVDAQESPFDDPAHTNGRLAERRRLGQREVEGARQEHGEARRGAALAQSDQS